MEVQQNGRCHRIRSVAKGQPKGFEMEKILPDGVGCLAKGGEMFTGAQNKGKKKGTAKCLRRVIANVGRPHRPRASLKDNRS